MGGESLATAVHSSLRSQRVMEHKGTHHIALPMFFTNSTFLPDSASGSGSEANAPPFNALACMTFPPPEPVYSKEGVIIGVSLKIRKIGHRVTQ